MQETTFLAIAAAAIVALTGLAIAAYAIGKLAKTAPGRLVAVLGALTALLGVIPAIFRALLGV